MSTAKTIDRKRILHAMRFTPRLYSILALCIVSSLGLFSLTTAVVNKLHRNAQSNIRDLLSFSVSFEDPVAMRISDTVHFQLDTDEGMQEFANLVPPSGHLVYVRSDASSEPQPYAVTLFHQMTCLDVVRQEFTQLPSSPAPQLVRHCMNYLRQTVLCRPSLFLESTVNSQALVSRAGYDVVCRDWNAVYEEAERNYAAYIDWSQEISNRR